MESKSREPQHPQSSNAPPWMTVGELAHYLGLSKATIYQYVCERRIPYVKIPHSNQVRFDRETIDAWMRDGRVPTVSEALKGENH